MRKYLGFKIIEARPMTLVEAEEYLQRKIKAGNEPGYLVIYDDGYKSWSPEESFEKSYRRIDNMTFGIAIEALKNGQKVARQGWNCKGMFLKLIPSGNAMYLGYPMQDCIGMKTANNVMQPGWLASQADILAEDWIIIG